MPADTAGVADTLPGTYSLLLYLPRTRLIRVGKLGEFGFANGHYCYVGSAFGPGGLRARLRHHARPAARPHWHIDYLRRYMTLRGVLAGGGAVPPGARLGLRVRSSGRVQGGSAGSRILRL